MSNLAERKEKTIDDGVKRRDGLQKNEIPVLGFLSGIYSFAVP